MTHSAEDRRAVSSYRGLTAEQLEEFNELDRAALAAGTGNPVVLKQRAQAMEDRARCVRLRAQHGLDIYEKLR